MRVSLNSTGLHGLSITTANSELLAYKVLSLATDSFGNVWIGTAGGGLARFDGTTWVVFNKANSRLPNNRVSSLAIDRSGNAWIGTSGGLARYDGTTWTVYDMTNSGLPDDDVTSLAIDGLREVWIGTWGGGLVVYREGGVIFDCGIKGDVTNEGSIDVLDVVVAVRISLQLGEYDNCAVQRADCNGDEVIDITDILAIVNVIIGLGTCWP